MRKNMWHVALKPGTTRLQDVIFANLEVNDFEIICGLLSTNHLKGYFLETERGNYLLMYGGDYERPFPSIIIWRYRISGEDNIIEDIRQEDAWVLEYVWREWLMPEDTDAEYIPPDYFLLMK